MDILQPDLRKAADYRTFLAERYTRIKRENPHLSHRAINYKVGARSAGWFSDVLAGRQRLKARHVTPLASLLKLDAAEKDLLKALVDLEAADSTEDKSSAYTKWMDLRGVSRTQVERDQFQYFERWYYPVLRELINLRPFDGDFAALGARLHPPISARRARDAAALLERLGLHHPEAPAAPPLLVKKAAKTPHWRKLMVAYHDLARPALAEFTKEERDFSALTLALSPESLREAGEEIAALRRRLLALSEKDAGKNRVYQCLFQVFPVSLTVEKSS